MKCGVSSLFSKACLFAIVILALAPVMPAQAHGMNAGIAAILLGSFALQFVVFPAAILIVPIFRGRRMYYFILYILFLVVYYFAVLNRLPVDLFIFPIIPSFVLAILCVAAWINRGQDGEEAQRGDPDGPLDRQS